MAKELDVFLACVQNGRLCSSCRTGRSGSSQNVSIPSPSSPVLFETVARSSPQMSDLATNSHPSDDDESIVDLSPQASPIPVTDLPLTLTDVNRKMTKAFGHGSILVQDDTLCNNPWTDRWQTITQLSGRHYSLPRRDFTSIICVMRSFICHEVTIHLTDL